MKKRVTKNYALNAKIIYKFFIFLLIPVIICAAFSYLLNRYFTDSYESYLSSTYSNDMNSFLNNVDEKLFELFAEAKYISDEAYVNKMVASTNPEDNNSVQLSEIERHLKKTVLKYNFLDSIILFNRATQTVVTEQGTYNAQDFFDNIYSYEDYSIDSLYAQKPIANGRKMLAPSTVTSMFSKKQYIVTPMLFSPVSTNAEGLVIFNIGAQNLFDAFSTYHFTEHSMHYMMIDNSDKFISNSPYPLVFDENEKEAVNNRYYHTINAKLNGQKHLVVCSDSNFSLLGYTYAIAIPYSDIEFKTRHTQNTTLAVLFAMVLLMFIFSTYATAKFSSPWNKIANELHINDLKSVQSGNTINKISSSITDLVHKNKDLTTKYATILPLSQQRYITEILNSPTSEVDDETFHMVFKDDFFSSIAIKIFSRSDTLEITSQLYSEMYIAIESVFADSFNVFRLPGTDNTLYLLLNTNEECSNDDINATVNHIKQLFKSDEDILNIYIGQGPLFPGADGLRLTHQKALSNLMDAINADRIQTNSIYPLRDYSVTDITTKTLFNYIMANYTDKAAVFIESAFQNSINKTPEYKQMLYTQMFNTFVKVLHLRGITHPDFDYESSSDFLKTLLQKSDSDILEYFKELLNTCDDVKMPSLKLDVTDVIKYIQEHYKDDISLEYLADYHHVSAPYLSKKLKQTLDMSFKEYLTELRVNEAKRLLCDHTEISIQDICKESGFFSTAAFTRAFKKSTGLSPREYRTLYKKQN